MKKIFAILLAVSLLATSVFAEGYFINKVACRLKDILELFMDTGIGRDGYSIIGQGKIEHGALPATEVFILKLGNRIK